VFGPVPPGALDQLVARAVVIVDEHHPTIRSQRWGAVDQPLRRDSLYI